MTHPPVAPRVRGVRIDAVAPGSPAERAGIHAGDRVVDVGGNPVDDLLDLHFHTTRSNFRLTFHRGGKGPPETVIVRAGDEPPGLHPEPLTVRRCRNKCVFCFVHQLPKGLRKPLYVKDEDTRLSFLHGQYVTLSDLGDDELRKIATYRLSPLYISVHATDDALRRRMLGNPKAAPIVPLLKSLVRKGIALHAQIVVCPGWNDGDVLLKTLSDLAAFRPMLRDVAVVPVGLTAHRKSLPALRTVTPDEARETVRQLAEFNRSIGAIDEGFALPADEYLLLSGAKFPGRRWYAEFAQIENGVGLVRRFRDESTALFRRKRWPDISRGGVVVSGVSAEGEVAPFLAAFSARSGKRFRHLPVVNCLMGSSVTVTGLLGGKDIADAVLAAGIRPGGRIFVPSVCLRDAGDLFLDGVSPSGLSNLTGSEVVFFDPTPSGFLAATSEA